MQSDAYFHDPPDGQDVPLFGPRELAELRRIARAEQAREDERARLEREGRRLARESRRAQGMSEQVELRLWDTEPDGG